MKKPEEEAGENQVAANKRGRGKNQHKSSMEEMYYTLITT